MSGEHTDQEPTWEEIDQLRAELEKTRTTLKAISRLLDNEENENQRLHDEIAELRKDKDRLDSQSHRRSNEISTDGINQTGGTMTTE